MRDRLIELLEQAEGQVNNDIMSLESIADYLIANGVILPPCKVGDTVYLIQIDYEGKYSVQQYLVNSKITMLSIMRAYEEKTVVYMSTDKNKAEQKLKEINI